MPMLFYAQGSWTVIQGQLAIVFIKMCVSIYDFDSHVTVTYVIVLEIVVLIIDSKHVIFGSLAVD